MANGTKPGRRPQLGIVATVVGLVLLVAYLFAMAMQWLDVEAKDLEWARHQQLLTSLEALGFTAVGALLGTTVQARLTKKADERADKAEKVATEEKRDAEKGRALHNAIKAKAASAADEADPQRGAARGGDPYGEMLDLAKFYDDEAR
jgi:hypothetical protein